MNINIMKKLSILSLICCLALSSCARMNTTMSDPRISTSTSQDELPEDYLKRAPTSPSNKTELGKPAWPVGGWDSVTKNLYLPDRTIPKSVIKYKFVVTNEGQVFNVVITQGIAPDVDEAVVRALQATAFEPAIRDGRKVTVRMAHWMAISRE
jgi:TonB family protein